MALPELDPEQRRAALEKAARNRRVRAELKQMLKAGEVSLREVVERADRNEALAKMRVAEVLEALPAFGKKKARDLMEQLDIASNRRIQGLGTNQRAALLAAIEAPS